MRWTALVMLVMLGMGVVEAYPLYGGNGLINCTVFGVLKSPVPHDRDDEMVIIRVDVSLSQIDESSITARYELVDGNDQVYRSIRGWSRNIQPGRNLVGFEVPRESVVKSLRIYPEKGNPFTIEWGALPEDRNALAVLRYYGMVESKSDPRSIVLDVGITNNGTADLMVGPDNFTLVDEWGWTYETDGSPFATMLKPNESMRSWITFSPISPFSRPTRLEYSHGIETCVFATSDVSSYENSTDIDPKNNTSQNFSAASELEPLVIYLENISRQGTSAIVAGGLSITEPGCGSSPCCKGAEVAVDPNSVQGKVAAAKARLEKVRT